MKYMDIAINEAKKAAEEGNVPVGCVIVKNEKVISVAHNKKNSDDVSVYHAEILAIISACNYLNSWNLDGCDMYVTLKPCLMCAGAIGESRIKNVYYILESNYYLNCDSTSLNINYVKFDDSLIYKNLMSDFFVNIRNIN